MFEIFLFFLKQYLSNALSGILIAGTAEDHTDGKRSDCLKFNRVLAVYNNWRDNFEEVGSGTASVGKRKSHEDTNLVTFFGGAFKLVGQDGVSCVCVIFDTTTENTES